MKKQWIPINVVKVEIKGTSLQIGIKSCHSSEEGVSHIFPVILMLLSD